MKIIKFPDPILFKKCARVESFDRALEATLQEMYQTMLESSGLGLSANQVSLDMRMFVLKDLEGPLFIVNPEITWKSLENLDLKEGCLSAPGEFLTLGRRSAFVTIKYQDEKGIEHKRTFTNIQALAVQHEIDHLDGISFLESPTLPREKRKELAKKWNLRKK